MEKIGKVFSAGIPTKPDHIWKYSTRINLKAFTTREKDTDVLHTPPLPTPKCGLMNVIEWESMQAFSGTSHDFQKLFSVFELSA